MTTPSVPFGRERSVTTTSEVLSRGGSKPRPRKGKNRAQDRKLRMMVNLELEKKMVKNRVVLYFDVYLSSSSTTTVGYQLLTAIPQALTQSARRGDTVFVTSIDVRMIITTANSDIFSTMRWGIFIWKQNTNSVTPGASSIYENTGTYGTLSPLNFEGRDYYSVLIDRMVNSTGVATAPTINSQVIENEIIQLRGHRIDFEQTLTTGTGHLYFCNVADSVIAPHAAYQLQTRVWYYDE